ncbi:vanadium-dependent haloperoxidase [Rhodocytophaga rosea]|uniref:Vanadium-dependent haloperoxidase n=1 Tax=Rhodocytophaga rosea TaxID=2704465 RepID=A0A6C0GDT8_9BACT|nr:vanadium-dependent haloperoxidase [Rhodocytophaga rosea]QHT66131.1 vanadium-dependent haloperoxidase [Rhodocytophaga rosea]
MLTFSCTYFKKYIAGFTLIGSLVVLSVGCDKSISEPDITPAAPASIDETGGSWKPILLSSSSAIPLPAPLATTTAEYQAELQEVKSMQGNLTDEMKKSVQYWAANPVLRWNEITRELVAKYNLAPASNPDGTYSAPDATNPTVYPLFPFSNPPYASRAYAMLTVAQYDALVAAWKYKYEHNRPTPSTVDGSITSLVPSTSLPSYPSEDAVIAAASLTILKALFPGEVEYLNAKAAEHKNSRLWAGANVKSDLAAGDSLGRKVAMQIMARAKADGMGAAAGNKDIWKAYEEATKARGEIPWMSQEIPARPPQLMSFGKVKPWMLTDADVVALRPSPPPATSSAEFKQALQEVKNYSENITREQFRIVSFWADGVGTYTPPGHWNAIASDIIVKNRMNPLRTARTLALMNTAMADAAICTWDVKYMFYLPRPSQIDPTIKTATGLPNFPSYTSGHSTFSGAAATVLSYVFPEEKSKVEAMANEASVSRIYGSIHYRFDCEVGLQCGKNIAAFAVEKGKADGSAQ